MTSPDALFTSDERAYLDGQRIGRLVTVDRNGRPQVRPVGFTATRSVIEIGGHELTKTRKFRNIEANPEVAFIVDDLVSRDPWQVRGIEVRGTADAVAGSAPIIRLHPRRIVTWGLDGSFQVQARDV
jgi:pyridoxamine 5'-phosphate oxidase family protein